MKTRLIVPRKKGTGRTTNMYASIDYSYLCSRLFLERESDDISRQQLNLTKRK